MAIKSLNQRLSIFLLLPLAALLFLMGFVGFFYAIEVLLHQWREASVLKLGRDAPGPRKKEGVVYGFTVARLCSLSSRV